jgi:excisionase family DNA binding protein
MDSYVTVSEAAKIKKVTRQAIYLAIREKKLRAYKHGDTFKVFLMDLVEYDRQRYSRVNSVIDGEKVFDEEKGCVSVEKAAQMISVPRQKLYYAVRKGMLKSTRKGNSYVINIQDLFQYQDKYLNKNFTKKKAG